MRAYGFSALGGPENETFLDVPEHTIAVTKDGPRILTRPR
jgi:hypothetical protein